MTTYRTTTIGLNSSPSGELVRIVYIRGLSLDKGDASDTSDGAFTESMFGAPVGWDGDIHRSEAVVYLARPTRVKSNIRVFSGTFEMRLGAPIAWDPGGNVTVQVWAIRRTLSSTLTGLTWANYTTGQAWQAYGAHTGPMWNGYRASLERWVATNGRRNAVLSGARATFTSFIACVSSASSPSLRRRAAS